VEALDHRRITGAFTPPARRIAAPITSCMKRRASSCNRDSMLSSPHPFHRRILSLFHRRVIRVLYQPEESMTCIARFQPDRSFLMPFAQLADQRICFEDTGGDGLPVILSHGFLMDREMFAQQVAALSPEFRVITWDERGFGQTESDGRPFTYWDSAGDCLALLDHLGIREAVFGGMSQGGFISLRAALLAPERVLGLVLMDTQAGAEDPEKIAGYRQLMDSWIANGLSEEVAQIIANIIIAEPEENARWIAKWKALRDPRKLVAPTDCLMEREDITARLPGIAAPALVIHGSLDTAIPLSQAEALCSGIGGRTELVVIEGAAHSANLTHAAAVNPPIRAFLRSLQAAAGTS
jgi:3-oxoadipate enol-lactonase